MLATIWLLLVILLVVAVALGSVVVCCVAVAVVDIAVGVVVSCIPFVNVPSSPYFEHHVPGTPADNNTGRHIKRCISLLDGNACLMATKRIIWTRPAPAVSVPFKDRLSMVETPLSSLPCFFLFFPPLFYRD